MTTQKDPSAFDVATKGAIGIAGATAIAVAYAAYVGAVVWVLWGWFVVPLGVPQITVAWAIGLCLCANMLVMPVPRGPANTKPTHHMLVRPAAFLLMGFIAKQWM